MFADAQNWVPGPPKLRLLPVHVATNPQMTIPLCSKLCSKYEYYGVRSHSECSCAGTYSDPSTDAIPVS